MSSVWLVGHLPRQLGADKMSGHSKDADLGMFCQEKSLRIPALTLVYLSNGSHGLFLQGNRAGAPMWGGVEWGGVGWVGDSNQVLQLF